MVRWRQAVCVLLGVYALLGGLISLLGWALDVSRLTDWLDSGISIQPNATICTILVGLGLTLHAVGRRRAGQVAGALAGAIAGLTVAEWLTGLDLYIDTVLMFDRSWGQRGVLYPGRMGPPGSVSMTLLGASLVLSGLDDPRLRKYAPRIALATLALTVFSFTGHLYDADVLYTMPRLTVISLQTSTFIAAVSAGVIALHPEQVPMRWLVSTDTTGIIARRAVPTVLVAPVVLGWLQLEGERRGYYDTSFGTALLVLALIGLLGAVLWRGLSTIARHEAALLGAEARLQLAITAGEAATWDLDMVSGRNVWSDSQFTMLGYRPVPGGEAERSLWQSAVPEEDLPLIRAEWRRAQAAHDVYRTEHRLRRADGSLIWARAAGRFHYDADGRAVRFVGVIFNITEEKTALEALRDADRRKDEFLAMLAHELRNPLAPIRNAVRVLQKLQPALPEKRWAAAVIDRQARRMTRLIDDLLDVERINRGVIELQPADVDVAQLVDEAVEASRPLLDQRGHELRVALPDVPLRLHADAVRLEQVLCNLLNNAAKYTPPGGHIELRVCRAGAELCISVRDDGIGMSAEDVPRVFEMYAQGDGAPRLAGVRDGLGIGLALAQRLVSLHGGRIEAHSAGPGRGSEFTVHLPLPAEPVPAPTPVVPDLESLPASSHRLLVVDDNRDAAESLAILLGMAGNEVNTAFDGPEAIRIARETRPNVIILDIGLPGLSGYDVARAIRSEPWAENVMLIALTGWDNPADRQRSKEAGFDHHLVKPVAPDELLQMLAAIPAPATA